MKLQGRVAAFLGDSITQGAGLKDRGVGRYDLLLGEECGFAKVYNHGLGGTRIAYQQTPTLVCPKNDLYFCGRAYAIEDDADLIVVFGGINDYLFGDAPFGEIGDTTVESFCGAIYFLMNLLREKHPEADIVFLTPTHSSFKGYDESLPSPAPKKKPCAKPLVCYVDAIRETAALFNIPVLDLYRDFGINSATSADREKYAPDGLHLNEAGHRALADRLKEFLISL